MTGREADVSTVASQATMHRIVLRSEKTAAARSFGRQKTSPQIPVPFIPAFATG